MRRNLRLLEDNGFLWIESGGQEIGSETKNIIVQVLWRRVFGKRVEISQKEITLIISGILKINKISERAQIIPDMQSSGGLDARYKNLLHKIIVSWSNGKLLECV